MEIANIASSGAVSAIAWEGMIECLQNWARTPDIWRNRSNVKSHIGHVHT